MPPPPPLPPTHTWALTLEKSLVHATEHNFEIKRDNKTNRESFKVI